MKRIAVYCRVSSDDQKERDTIDNQVDILNTYIEMDSTLKKVSEYLDDGISGTIPFQERPFGKKLIEDAEKGLFDTVLVWKIDRFGRDTLSGLSSIELLRNYNVEIISITEPFDLNTPTGRFQFITYLNMAELERNNILDRMFLGATRAAKQGKWLGGIVPYGYYVNKDKYLEINEFEATIVRWIFDIYINKDFSTLDISVYLNNLGVDSNYAIRGTGKNRNSSKKSLWSTSSIQRMLSNKTYAGIHEYGKRSTRRKETIVREVPAIIPLEVFDEAAKKRKDNILIAKRNSPNRDFLLRQLVVCGECGRKYYGTYYKSKNDVYSCSGKKTIAKRIYNLKCTNPNVKADFLEEYVWKQCEYVMLNYNKYKLKKDSFLEEKKSLSFSIEQTKENLNKLELEKNNIIKLFRKNIIDESELNVQITDIRVESEKLKKILEKNKYELEKLKNKDKIINSNENLIKIYTKNLQNLSLDEKKEIIKLLIKEIVINSEIEDSKKKPYIKIVWNMSDLLFEPTRMKILSQTYNYHSKNKSKKKLPIIYAKNPYRFYGENLSELRIKNNINKTSLAKSLNISLKTLNDIESGKNNNPYYYYYIYCRHFALNPNNVLDFSLIKTDTFLGKIEFLKANLGIRNLKELDFSLNLRPGSIAEYLSGRFKNKNIEILVMNKFNEIKNK